MMRTVWIVLSLISLLIIGCAPSASIQKTYLQTEQQKAGPVKVFNSFDEVGASYKKVAELKVTDQRAPGEKLREKMIESLKAKARKLGANGIVMVEEGTSISKMANPFGSGEPIVFHGFFIRGTAILL